jgi:hypothetical protein
MDIIKIIEKINEVGLSNNDITRYGDGFVACRSGV